MATQLFFSEMSISDVIRVIKSDELECESAAWAACLILAIQKKNDELFSLVLQKYLEGKAKINLDQPVQNGLNFLSFSIMHDHFDYFQKLLVLGASPLTPIGRNIAKMNQKLRSISAACDSLNMTPLSVAVDLGRLKMIEKLRELVDKKELIRQALRISSLKEKEEMRACLLKDCDKEVKSFFNKKVKENDFKSILSLLKLKVLKTLDFEDEEGYSPLLQSVRHQAYETFIVLKEAREEGLISFNENFVSLETSALNEAILSNQTKFIKNLLFMGADPLQDLGEISSETSEKKIKKTPLYSLTLQSLQNKEAYGKTLFYISCLLPEVSIATEAVKIAKFLNTQKVYKILLKNSSDLSKMPVYAEKMIQAVREGNVDLVSFLVQRRVSPLEVKNGTMALYEAAKLGKTDVLNAFIKELPSKKLDTPFKGVSPFLTALWYGKEAAALLLAKAGAQIPDRFLTGENILKRVVDFDMAFLLNEILLKKAKLKTSMELKEVFWQAVTFKRNKVVKLLCDLKMDVSYKNKFGMDLLHLAAKKRNFEAVRLLLLSGADMDTSDYNKMTPLHYAILNKDEQLSFFLIEKGANVNAKNICGQTPLMYAAQTGMKKIAAVLIEYRADALAKDKNGQTAFYYYKKYKEKQLKPFNAGNQKIKE